ncbi:class A beta-lactamase-related serine hydrolase [Gramella jeungdoensis]|uniref:Class A beta-lactamase-related serine hydrolase n=1 Tax=Gramella jeungdoensis TaxID=708091 RepID=A0ABT0YYJ1_9FLAO|nr:class A beta-lactamase-related serine hydrolase [Gramella jeungdoensis]MCM8568546.1 class A beta-lactamase-related serine hydrolase [Gramella jeungdoensis]
MKFYKSIFYLLFLIGLNYSYSQTQSYSELEDKILKADSLLFQEGFNNCDFYALSKLTDDSLKFYHDISGVITGNEEFIQSIKNNICSIDYHPVRKLLSENHRIYPLKQNGEIYGAIQIGKHEFYAVGKGKKEYLTSIADFTHLWLKKEGNWILQNVLSYNHQKPGTSVQATNEKRSIQQLLIKNRVPALGLALLEKGKLTKLEMYGNLFDKQVAPIDAVFNVASLTKPIVTMLTLKLVENGNWDLDEPVYLYWTDPDVKNLSYSKLLTTRHILTHQSGFPNWRWENEDKKLKFKFKPGEGYGYSGEGYEYLKKALETKFEKPIENLADSLLFTPLGMDNTFFKWNASIDEDKFAKWHDSEGQLYKQEYKNKNVSAADNLLTTIYDYGKFAEYVLAKVTSGDSLYKRMVTRGNGKDNQTVIGLGWELLPELKNDEYALLHTGGDIGVNTLIMFLPKTMEGIIIFTNGDNGNKLFFDLIERNLSLGSLINKTAQ